MYICIHTRTEREREMSLAVSAADVVGSSPNKQLGSSLNISIYISSYVYLCIQMSMAVSAADVVGSSPNMQLGSSPSIFLRRQASKRGGKYVLRT